MKQLLILSGKGGTGKTTVATAFIQLSKAKGFADCDVDAPNLHLLMKPSEAVDQADFYGLGVAEINQNLCISCGLCKINCRFDAISSVLGKPERHDKPDKPENVYHVDPFGCEGCGLCAYVCPVDAIQLKPSKAGDLMLYKGDSVFSTAKLKMGRGTSGMLVTEVKKRLRNNFQGKETDITIIDGSPGIGCPVIASISGVDLVLIVAEPSLSGISDMERILETANKFQTKTAVCINKYDTNLELSDKIRFFCSENKIPFMGIIPYDRLAVDAINQSKSIVEIPCEAGQAVRSVYDKTRMLMDSSEFPEPLFPLK